MRQDNESGAVLIVGGGRWARVYLSVLAGLEPPCPKTIIVSRHGGGALVDALAKANARRPGRFSRVEELAAMPEDETTRAAIIVNAARDHAASALSLLAQKIPVLIEKPVAMTQQEAQALIDASRTTNTLAMPGHVLSFCHYLENFAAAVRALGAVQSVALHWHDPLDESRYGESKSHDSSLGLAEDIGPHLFTILTSVLGGQAGSFAATTLKRGGLDATVEGTWNDIRMTLSLARDSDRRERLVVVKVQGGQEARLDFTSEPGTITIAGQSSSADPHWPRPQSPLALQLAAFLAARGTDDRMCRIITDATAFIAMLAGRVRTAQAAWFASPAWDAAAPDERLVTLRELLAPLLLEAGCWRAGDAARLNALARRALQEIAGKSPRPALPDLVQRLCSDG